MNSTILTILSIALILVSAGYFLVYAIKKKNNTHGSMGYRFIFLSMILLLVIPIVYSAL